MRILISKLRKQLRVEKNLILNLLIFFSLKIVFVPNWIWSQTRIRVHLTNKPGCGSATLFSTHVSVT